LELSDLTALAVDPNAHTLDLGPNGSIPGMARLVKLRHRIYSSYTPRGDPPMSIAEQHDAISLTVLRQDGNLAASLTDTRLIAKLAHCALLEAQLRDLQRDVQELLTCCADSGLGKVLRTVASARVRTLGERIFDTLLPEPVGSFLRGSPARNGFAATRRSLGLGSVGTRLRRREFLR